MTITRRKIMHRRNCFMVVLVALLMLMGSMTFATGQAEGTKPVTWKLVVPANPGQPLYELSVELIQERIVQETNGRMELEIFSETEMGTGPELVLNLRAGVVEMHWEAFAITQSYVPEFLFTSLPFIFSDRDHFRRFKETEAGQALLSTPEKYGIYILETDLIGYRYPVSSNVLFKSPDDFKGFRMRTMDNILQIDTMRALGANPVVLPYGDVYEGIKKGVVDGYFNDRNSFVYLSIYEVAPYLTELPLFSLGLSLVVSKSQFDALPDDLQQTLRRVVKEASQKILDTQWSYNIEEEDWKSTLFTEYAAISELKLKPFIEKVQPVYEQFISKNPESEKFVEAVEATR